MRRNGDFSAARIPSGCEPLSDLSSGSQTGNPLDVHLHTGLNLRRYLVQLEGLSLRTTLLALFLWHTGGGDYGEHL
jgi:hypothetical protein